jgi:hypothetical protein
VGKGLSLECTLQADGVAFTGCGIKRLLTRISVGERHRGHFLVVPNGICLTIAHDGSQERAFGIPFLPDFDTRNALTRLLTIDQLVLRFSRVEGDQKQA